MKRFLILLLALTLFLGTFVSCGDAKPSDVPGSSSVEDSGSEASQTLEPITEAPETDPFEGAEPLPADLAIPDAVKSADGTVIGTIVLPAGADANETTAAEELRYHIQKVTGADLPVVGRPSEEYGSLIVCSPASLPAIAELFPDDLAWLSDLGGGEESRWCPDGFAIRTLGKDVYIFGNITRGTLNGAYDWIEENLGVLWVRADEELGLLYDEQPEVTALKTDYREKSPFALRGWVNNWGTAETFSMWSRNKLNWRCANWLYAIGLGQYIQSQITESPLYDPEVTEYWNTDEEGNRLTQEQSPQINFFSEKAVEAITAYCLLQVENGEYAAYIGEMDVSDHPYCRPDDTQPFEYAPGQFVNPEDEDYLSTVYWTFINKVARNIKEKYPDGKLGTYAYQVGIIPPRCEIEDNVLIWLAPIGEDLCYPLLSQEVKNKTGKSLDIVRRYCDFVPAWAEKSSHIEVYNYYGISRAQHQVTIPFWNRMQTDFQDYVRLGFEGVSSEGVADCAGLWTGGDDKRDELFPYHSWTMNGLLFWLYSKLAWNPWEDVDALIETFCDRYYGAASADMKEYYRLIKQGWDETTPSYKQTVFFYTHYTEYYKKFIKPAKIGHPVLDALDRAIAVTSGRIQEEIQYMRDTFFTNISSFQNW